MLRKSFSSPTISGYMHEAPGFEAVSTQISRHMSLKSLDSLRSIPAPSNPWSSLLEIQGVF